MPYTAIYSYLQTHLEEMLAFLGGLVRAESPSTDPAAQTAVQAPLTAALEDLAYTVQHVPGRRSGGHLLATPAAADPAAPRQLLLAHTDTVWPLGTLAAMPLARDGRSLRGPGVFDMKGSLAMLVFVLRALRHLELTPAVTPVLLLNSDEEIGSHESRPAIEQQARQACRALVLEPAFGPDGRLKTARKGVGRFAVTITGQAAHAGIEPEKGASAILELAAVIQQLHALNDLPRGVSVNVGLVSGGVLTNVVAPHARADVDLRAPTQADAARLDAAVRALRPTTPGTTLAVSGGFERPPLERTPANQALWRTARALGRQLGLDLAEASTGGGSDGNLTSPFTATLDGLGPIGGGAHAPHEFLLVDSLVERGALLAALLLSPCQAP